jgi:signal transduction histidine kinase
MEVARRLSRHLQHLAFALIAGGSALRMLQLNSPMCPRILSLSVLLALGYAGGLALGDRLGRWQPLWVAVLILVWLSLVWLAPAAAAGAFAWIAVPLACVAMARLGPRASAVTVMVIAVLLVVVLVRHAGGFEPDLVLAPVAAVLATLALYRVQQRDATERRQLVAELRRTRAELAVRQREAGASAERARIAREIHDTLAQELAGSRILLQAAERDWLRSPEKARTRVRAVTESLGESLLETRRIIDDLTPVALDRNDLEDALRELCLRAERSGTARSVRFTSTGRALAGAGEQAAILLRVTQGALANVRDHARAANVMVTLGRRDGLVILEVRDDGVGFVLGRSPSRPGRGFGLAGIRERLRAYGGTVTVDSAPGRGTVLTAALPVRLAAPARHLVAG